MKLKELNLFILLVILSSTIQNCRGNVEGVYYEKIGNLNLNFTIRGEGPIMIVGHPSAGKIGYELSLTPLEKYFTMVYYEPRGTGKSEAPRTLNEYSQVSLVNEIEDLRKFLKSDKIWLFGHSDQSAIALMYALAFPENLSGLILSGTSYIGTQQETIERRKKSEESRMKESEWFANVIANWDYIEKYKTDKDEKGNDLSATPIKWWCYNEESSQKVIPIVKEITKLGRRKPIDGQNYFETIEERQNYLTCQLNFYKITTRILIVNGKFDTNNSPQYVEELSRNLPNSKLELIDAAGHFPWIENPEETFEKITSWLNICRN